MPIRGFDQLSHPRNILKLPISVLHDTAVAVDGFWYLRKYHPNFSWATILNVYDGLKEFLGPLCELSTRTQIIWIWDGLDYRKNNPTKSTFTSSTGSAHQVLSKGVVGNSSEFPPSSQSSSSAAAAAASPSSRHRPDQEVYVQAVTELLRASGIIVVRAPYSAMAQCVYLVRENCVKYMFSKNDALLFSDCRRLITEFSPKSANLEVVDRNALFAVNGINLESFRHVALLCGCELCPTVPMYASNFDLREIIGLLRRNTSSFATDIEEYCCSKKKKSTQNKRSDSQDSDSGRNYLDVYTRAFFSLIYHPVMTLDGIVRCFESTDAPGDLSEIFGHPLPFEVYYELFCCNMSPIVLNEYLDIKTGSCLARREIVLSTAAAIDQRFFAQKIEKKDRSEREPRHSEEKLRSRAEPVARLCDSSDMHTDGAEGNRRGLSLATASSLELMSSSSDVRAVDSDSRSAMEMGPGERSQPSDNDKELRNNKNSPSTSFLSTQTAISVSEALRRALNALNLEMSLSSEFNELIQVAFMKLYRQKFNRKLLVDMLNRGFLGKGKGSSKRNGSDRKLRIEADEKEEFYVAAAEYLISLRDFILISSISAPEKNDCDAAAPDLLPIWRDEFGDLPLHADAIAEFLRSNIRDSRDLSSLMSVLSV